MDNVPFHSLNGGCTLFPFSFFLFSFVVIVSPYCVRICLDGMGKTGSSNRPYALCLADFNQHFDTISVAYRGLKKAKLCLYEQPAHRPRIEWLRQMTQLVFGGAYESGRYQVRAMAFDGHRLYEEPQPQPQLQSHVQPPSLPSSLYLDPRSASLRRLECDEELSLSEDDSDAPTIVESQSPQPHHQPYTDAPFDQPTSHSDSQETVFEEEEEFQLQHHLDHTTTPSAHQDERTTQLLHSPIPFRTPTQLNINHQETQIPPFPTAALSTHTNSFAFLPLGPTASTLSGVSHRPLSLGVSQSSSHLAPALPVPSHSHRASVSFDDTHDDTIVMDQHEFESLLAPTMHLTQSQTHAQSRVDSKPFLSINKHDSIAADSHAFYQQQLHSATSGVGLSSASPFIHSDPFSSPPMYALSHGASNSCASSSFGHAGLSQFILDESRYSSELAILA